jgi:hypothetical protein
MSSELLYWLVFNFNPIPSHSYVPQPYSTQPSRVKDMMWSRRGQYLVYDRRVNIPPSVNFAITARYRNQKGVLADVRQTSL